jgi:drug/metabolite transporter (DMT)-like permease
VGYVYALLSALLFGANGSISKVVMEAGVSPVELTLFRTLGSCLLAGGTLLVVDRAAFRVNGRQLAILAVLGVAGVAVLQAAYALAVQRLPVGIALLIEYLAVLFVAVIAFAFLKERVKARLWLAIACVLTGLAIVAEVWASSLDGFGVVMALLAACSLTLYFLVGERQVSTTSPLAVAFYTTGFAALFWSFFSGWWTIDPVVFARPVSLSGNLAAIEIPLWMPLLACVVGGSFLPFLLSFAALRHLSATVAGIVASAEVIIAFVVAWLWLGETLSSAQLIGAAVVLAGIVLAQTARDNRVIDADLALDVGGRS